ncbi:MAG: hypothetical protein ABIK53_08130 [bacterium]
MKTEKIVIKMHGVTLGVSCKEKIINKTIQSFFSYFISVQKKSDIDIEVVFMNKREEFIFGLIKNYDTVGRRIFISGDDMVVTRLILFSGTSMQCNYKNKKLYLKMYFDNSLKPKLLTEENIIRKLFFYIIFFPLFWYLSQVKCMFLLHGGGVRVGSTGIVFSGLQGVGKSTIILSLVNGGKTKFLSDNLYLYDSNNVYQCFESIRIDQKAIDFIGLKQGVLDDINIDTDLGRRLYKINKKYMIYSFSPDTLLIPQFARKTELVQITVEECLKKCLTFNRLAGEVREYDYYSAPLDLLVKNENYYRKHIASLELLIKRIKKRFVLNIRKGDNRENVLKKTIYKII